MRHWTVIRRQVGPLHWLPAFVHGPAIAISPDTGIELGHQPRPRLRPVFAWRLCDRMHGSTRMFSSHDQGVGQGL
jgi:hypothetical protein